MLIKTKAWGQVPICRSNSPPSFKLYFNRSCALNNIIK